MPSSSFIIRLYAQAEVEYDVFLDRRQRLLASGASPRRHGAAAAKRLALPVLTVVSLFWVSGTAVSTQSTTEIDALKARIKALEARQRELELEIQALRRTVQATNSRPPNQISEVGTAVRASTIDIAAAPYKGTETAPIVLVEFSDYQCGFCARHVRETLPQIEREYIRAGKVKYVFVDFPNHARHRFAQKAHEAAACAGDQGKYWEMHDMLFTHQSALAATDLQAHAGAIGLTAPAFRACLDASKHDVTLRKGLAKGQAVGVTATPTFFIGTSSSSTPTLVTVSHVIRGAKPFAVFKQTLDEALARRR